MNEQAEERLVLGAVAEPIVRFEVVQLGIGDAVVRRTCLFDGRPVLAFCVATEAKDPGYPRRLPAPFGGDPHDWSCTPELDGP